MGGWVLFRSADLSTALDYFASLIGRNGAGDISFDMHDALERAGDGDAGHRLRARGPAALAAARCPRR